MKFVTGGMGSSDPPGWFFWPALALAVTALVVFLLDWSVAAAACGLGALILGILSLNALSDGFGVCCVTPKCDYKEATRPWSM